jgi:hypothetical protein
MMIPTRVSLNGTSGDWVDRVSVMEVMSFLRLYGEVEAGAAFRDKGVASSLHGTADDTADEEPLKAEIGEHEWRRDD